MWRKLISLFLVSFLYGCFSTQCFRTIPAKCSCIMSTVVDRANTISIAKVNLVEFRMFTAPQLRKFQVILWTHENEMCFVNSTKSRACAQVPKSTQHFSANNLGSFTTLFNSFQLLPKFQRGNQFFLALECVSSHSPNMISFLFFVGKQSPEISI